MAISDFLTERRTHEQSSTEEETEEKETDTYTGNTSILEQDGS